MGWLGGGVATGQAPAGPAGGEVVYLNQGWSPAMRQQFYWTYQGSQLIPYRWFLVLEQDKDTAPFRAATNLEPFGYLPHEAKTPLNPDGLPIGFTKDHDPKTGDWVGFTCAACHTTQITYRGKTIRVDGAPTLADYTRFDVALRRALAATAADDAKFHRFEEAVLGKPQPAADTTSAIDPADRARLLRLELRAYLAGRDAFAARNRSEVVYGPGRLDALGILVNEIVGTDLRIPENYRQPDAPVSYPALWLTARLAAVEWNGSVTNPLMRNIGELLGVFGHATLAGPTKDLFDSTVVVRNQIALEELVGTLKPPAWPEEVFGTIDQAKARRGAEVYQRSRCAECHAGKPEATKPDYGFPLTPPNGFGKQFIRVWLEPLDRAGTDAKTATNFADRVARTGYLSSFFGGLPAVPGAAVTNLTTSLIARRQFEELRLTDAEIAAAFHFQDAEPRPATPDELAAALKALPQSLRHYKAGPLAGIWATAPYLHNGSVPNLYQLLLSAEKRVKTFFVGSREFDPVNVGFVSDQAGGPFRFDTSIDGNHNTGHEYAPDMSDEDRWDLVEYLKTF
jgi:hypothetical protein